MTITTPETDIIIIGAGLSGLLSAVAMADPSHGAARSVRLIDAGQIERQGQDGRATTLSPSSLRLLSRLNIEIPSLAIMSGMRVGEGKADSPWMFDLGGAGLEAQQQPLAYVTENAQLRAALLRRAAELNIIFDNECRLSALSTNGRADITLMDGSRRRAALILACDGRNSAVRRLAGFNLSRTDLKQHALVTTVRHDEPHDGIALQRFLPVGAIASLPLPDKDGAHRSQIVWSDRKSAILAACALPRAALAALINERLWHALTITDIEGVDRPSNVQYYPLTAQRSDPLSQPRIALVGDAARTIHPLAGQGFNLAIRDIAVLTEGVREASATGQDIGTAGLIGYDRWRRADETSLGLMTRALSSATQRGPLRLLGHVRRSSFALVDAAPMLHPLIRQEAAGEWGQRPPLLQ